MKFLEKGSLTTLDNSNLTGYAQARKPGTELGVSDLEMKNFIAKDLDGEKLDEDIVGEIDGSENNSQIPKLDNDTKQVSSYKRDFVGYLILMSLTKK